MPALWSTETDVAPGTPGGKTILYPREVMYPGDFFDSPNLAYRLTFQTDGNVVLVALPDTVLWSTGVLGGEQFVMQSDGNLVLYAGSTALWASGTDENPNAYLALQNDGNLVIYSQHSLESLACFSINPDWADGVSEVLAWNTGLQMSPSAVEQRLGLRLSPRQSFELSYTVRGPTRTLFDLLTIRGGGSPVYLPIWQDQERLTTVAPYGSTSIAVETAAYTQFDQSPYLCLWLSPFEYELVEISAVYPTVIQLAAGLKRSWPAQTKVYPVKKCRYESQPTTSRRADGAFVARVRFLVLGDRNRGWYDPVSAPSGYEATCLHEFLWNAGHPTDNDNWDYGQQPDRLDKWGHLYRRNGGDFIEIWGDSGTLVNTLTQEQLADLINGWYGTELGPIVPPGGDPPDYRGIKLQPIFYGEYVMAWLMALGGGPFTSWWALLDPHADGTFDCLGAVYMRAQFGPPYFFFQGFRCMDVWRMNDPIYVEGDYSLFDNATIIWTLPSINEYLSDTYKGGYHDISTGADLPDCRIPIVARHPFGNNIDLVQFWMVNGGEGNFWPSRNFGFILPSSHGGLNFYTYVHSLFMDDIVAGAVTPEFIPEMYNVIQPANPDGCMIKINMGEYTFAELAAIKSYGDTLTFRGIPTASYTVDNGNWTLFDGITPAIPFRDERTYISNDLPGGWDHYQFQTSIVERPGGRYWIFFYMVGRADAKFRAGVTSPAFGGYASPVYLRFKLFEYNPGTETARLLTAQTCVLFDDVDIGAHDETQLYYAGYQIFVVSQSGSQVTLTLRGHINKMVFAQFTVPG